MKNEYKTRNKKGAPLSAPFCFGREERTTEPLRRVGLGHSFDIGGGQHYRAHVRAVTAVAGARGQGLCPHFFIGQPMRAYNGGAGKLVLDPLYLGNVCQFEVHNNYISAMFGNGMEQSVKVVRRV